MKKNILFLLTALSLIGFAACSKLDIAKDTPKCIQYKITDFNETGSCDSAKVDHYTFLREDVYLFDPGACSTTDSSFIYNFDCVNLGYIGGIKHPTSVLGKPWTQAVFVETIWKK